VISLNYDEYCDWNSFIDDVRLGLGDGFVLIKTLITAQQRDQLVALVQSIGSLSQNASTYHTDDFEKFVKRIEVASQPHLDNHGFPIYSSTPWNFPCHTDDFFNRQPPSVIVFECVRQDPCGGDSMLVTLSQILPQLEESTIAQLKLPNYPSYSGLVPILTLERNELVIRYNRLQIERGCRLACMNLSPVARAALDELDRAIDAVKIHYRLRPGECLFINNKKALHGRTSFSRDSGRLIRKVKVYQL
jgi:alpha-ketoglutarate-dependent taurine dioxygenase